MFLVVGSTTVDLFVTGLDHLPGWGADEFALDNLAWCQEPLRMVIGGNGANSAFVLGKLGAEVALASAVGVDPLGNIMSNWLAHAGVDGRWLARRAEAGTSSTTIVADAARRRVAFHHAGAYATFGLGDLPAGWAGAVEALLLTSYPLMAALRGVGYAALLAAAQDAGALTAVDVGPAIGQPATLVELAPMLPAVDYLLANRHELAVLTGADAVDDQIRRVLGAGARTLVLKEGAEGARLCTLAGETRVPAVPCTVRQTVGAGDSFNAGFLLGLRQGLSPAAAIALGNRTAASVISNAHGVLAFPGPS